MFVLADKTISVFVEICIKYEDIVKRVSQIVQSLRQLTHKEAWTAWRRNCSAF
jgi:hypothetical protein